ncbi:uncharacterized protein BKA55DRAFT_559351 [Fusarium redolens]|uniref:Secreted protein n=1 Tax=Fusarium redolens TaxID=48865 RepID=A0A9P9HYG7_FUSRE|nr:uncharacterized protein BKA55DRAFT_559351 [Fusarium redolens]KAH7265681.1 hypothetical protein BKA55DRAFT_559351 [Fusarium redolens]
MFALWLWFRSDLISYCCCSICWFDTSARVYNGEGSRKLHDYPSPVTQNADQGKGPNTQRHCMSLPRICRIKTKACETTKTFPWGPDTLPERVQIERFTPLMILASKLLLASRLTCAFL